MLNSRGLGSGDGVAEVDGPPGHVDTGGCNECDQLAECERLGRKDGGRSADSSAAAASALAD